jgi:hypothetical protein
MQILFPKLILTRKKATVVAVTLSLNTSLPAFCPLPLKDSTVSAGIADTSVTKVGSLGDGVLSSLKCLLLLLLLLNEAEDVHGFGSNGY